jgi:mRNA-degrading endonuclease RelE of RelBE toxin-antitoxin system
MKAYYKRPVQAAIKELAINPRPKKAELLKRKYKGVYRLSVLGWRIIYRIDDYEKVVLIEDVKLKTGPETYENLDIN